MRRYEPEQVSNLLHEVRRDFEHQIFKSSKNHGKYLDQAIAATKTYLYPVKGQKVFEGSIHLHTLLPSPTSLFAFLF